jgi:hypothetical protein
MATPKLQTTIEQRAAAIAKSRVRVRVDQNSALVTGNKIVDGEKAKYETFLVNPETGNPSCTCFNYRVTVSKMREAGNMAAYECKHVAALRLKAV